MEISVSGFLVCQGIIVSCCAIINVFRKIHLNKLKILDDFIYEDSIDKKGNKKEGVFIGKYIRTIGQYYPYKIAQLNDFRGKKRNFLTKYLVNGRCSDENISLLNRIIFETYLNSNIAIDLNNDMYYNHFLYENDYVALVYKQNNQNNYFTSSELIQGNLYDLKNYYKENNDILSFIMNNLYLGSIFFSINFVIQEIIKYKEKTLNEVSSIQYKDLESKYNLLEIHQKRKFDENVLKKLKCNKCKNRFKTILILNCGHFNLCKNCFDSNHNKCFLCDVSDFSYMNIV